MKIFIALFAALFSLGTATAVSAQSTVDDQRPGAPQPLEITGQTRGVIDLQWRRSTDNTGIASYRLYDRGQLIFEWQNNLVDDNPNNPFIPTRAPFEFDHGLHWFQLQALDLAGNESVRTSPVPYFIDRDQPSAAFDLSAAVSETDGTKQVAVEFTVLADDLASCTLLRNLVPRVEFDPGAVPDGLRRYTVVDDDAAPGHAWYQIQCVDTSGNSSVRSAPLYVADIGATS